MSTPFGKDNNAPATKALIKWWEDLENDKGTRAELRRCATPQEVMLHPAYVRLRYQLQKHLPSTWHWELHLACVIGLLTHVREPGGTDPLAKQMGGKEPKVSELRFRRLLKCDGEDREDFYRHMIRILRLLGKQTNLPDLIRSVFYWNDPTRREWAQYYFSNTPDPRKKSA